MAGFRRKAVLRGPLSTLSRLLKLELVSYSAGCQKDRPQQSPCSFSRTPSPLNVMAAAQAARLRRWLFRPNLGPDVASIKSVRGVRLARHWQQFLWPWPRLEPADMVSIARPESSEESLKFLRKGAAANIDQATTAHGFLGRV